MREWILSCVCSKAAHSAEGAERLGEEWPRRLLHVMF